MPFRASGSQVFFIIKVLESKFLKIKTSCLKNTIEMKLLTAEEEISMNRKYLKLLWTALLSLCLSTTVFTSTVNAQTLFTRANVPAQVKITASSLNVRSGPSVAKIVVGLLYKDQIVDCIGKIGTWWVIHLENDTVGLVSGNYAKPYYPPSPAPTPSPTPSQLISNVEEQKMLDLINSERSKVGLTPLKLDSKLMEVAKLKAEDMVKNNYFSHTSPTYGSPFDMMKKFGITFQTAAENLAGNSSVEAAHNALMLSEEHRKNILNSSYDYIGIGISPSPVYGKVFVQMFIGR